MILIILQLLAAHPVVMPPPPPPPPIFQQAQQPQGPSILPSHRHGPHAGEPGAVCYPGETQKVAADRTLYHCVCQFLCDIGAGGEPLQREADECETSCGTDQCACHPEEACPMPEAPK